jgi:uncharacterized protein YndB with AHSA1/START domain
MSATCRTESGRGFGEVFIPRSPDDVFSYLTNLSNMVTWWPEHRHYKRLRGDGTTGSLYGWTYVMPMLAAVGITSIREYQPASRFAYRVIGTGFTMRLEYTLTPENGGTRLNLLVQGMLLRIAFGRKMFAEEVVRSLDKLVAELGDARTISARS